MTITYLVQSQCTKQGVYFLALDCLSAVSELNQSKNNVMHYAANIMAKFWLKLTKIVQL